MILKTVLKFLSQNEIDKPLTISNIAQELDIGKSTIYEYFNSKEEMLLSAMNLLNQMILDSLIKPEDLTLSFEQALKKHLDRLYEHAKKHEMLQEYVNHPDIGKLPREAKQHMMETMHETVHALTKFLRDILDIGVSEGIIKAVGPMRRAVVESLMFGGMFLSTDPFRHFEADALIAETYQAVLTLHR